MFSSEADILIGGFSRHPEFQHVFSTTSALYFMDDATWCVQAAPQKSRWKNIFYIFSMKLWIAIFAMFLVISLIIYFHYYFDKKQHNISWVLIHTLKICIGMAFEFKSKKNLIRFIFFIFFVYGFIISASFHSGTVRSITGEYYDKQIDSLNEMVKSKFKFVGSSFSMNNIMGRNDKVRCTIVLKLIP